MKNTHDIDLIGKLADLKTEHYRNSLLLSALIELLLERRVFTLDELQTKASQLDVSFYDTTNRL